MNGRVNNKIWLAIWVFVLFLAGFVWNCGTVSGAVGNVYPVDGSLIYGTVYTPTGNIYTFLDASPDPNAVSYVCYFSHIEAEVAGRVEDANLGPQVSSVPNLRWIVGLPDDVHPGDPYPDGLVRGTMYYWAVDAFDAEDNKFAGDVWEFGIQIYFAFAPDPPNEAVDVETDVLLNWREGVCVDEHDVYMGTNWDDVYNANWDDTTGIYKGYTLVPNYQCSDLAFNTKYYWRIDELCGLRPPWMSGDMNYILRFTLYKGDVWSFTTEEQRIYVDVDAAGANDGTSWENAYNYLQDALIEAYSALKPVEIRVAEGIYKPDRSTSDPNGSSNRSAYFVLIDGVTIKGGYAGFGEPDPDARDIEAYETILSGDLDGNDVDVNDPADLLDEPTRAENSYHVVFSYHNDANAILDGFTITSGNANVTYYYNYGGGIYCELSSPIIISCRFSLNTASFGGGMFDSAFISTGHQPPPNYLDLGKPVLSNCTFIMNAAENSGGGMYNWDHAEPTVINCRFINNRAYFFGGGMYNGDSNSIITNCTFIGNSTFEYGGGMSNRLSNPIVTGCTFRKNWAVYGGGGMANRVDSSPIVINCLFVENEAFDVGSGIYSFESSPRLMNSTFSCNWSHDPGGCTIFGDQSYTLTNCIVWGDWLGGWFGHELGGPAVVTYSNIQGGWPGEGNIDADPCFVDAGGGDFRLSSDSPCIDAGINNAPNLPATDMDGHPRIIDGDCNDTEVVDMGAYEFNYAYMGDFDYSCGVDFADFSIIALAWMAEPGDHNWDPICNIGVPADSLIDWRDVAILCDNWLADNNPGRYCIVEDNVKYCIRTDKSVYRLGETVGILYRITNLGSVPVNLGWVPMPPFCYRFAIVDNKGEHVWLWSWVMPPSPPVEFILDAYESKEHEIGWDMINDNGTYGTNDDFPAGPGVYKITGELLTGSEEDRVKVSVYVNVRE